MKRPPDWTYDLHVFGTEPKKMPMDALAEVMKRLADLMGSQAQLRFRRLKSGSAALLVAVEDEAKEAVNARLIAVRLDAGASPEAAKLDKVLGAHGWRAELRRPDGGVVLNFPGAANDAVAEKKSVKQHDSVLGTVIKIGGRDDSVPMTLKTPSGEYVEVTVKGRDLARRLARQLFDREVRVYGTTTWARDEEGQWSCETMLVDGFDVLDATGLTQLFDELRAMPLDGSQALGDETLARYKAWKSEEDE